MHLSAPSVTQYPDDRGDGIPIARKEIYGIEVLQLFGKRGRSEGPVTADVDPPQKNHECHEFPSAEN